jgi:hypothetical protein
VDTRKIGVIPWSAVILKLTNLKNFHLSLINSGERTSSSRYIVLGSFYVSSILTTYTAIVNPAIFAEIFWIYIIAYVAGYGMGKWLGKKKDMEENNNNENN